MKTGIKHITRAAAVAAMYTALSLLSNILGLASGALQLRLSEALCLMPLIFPESIWGLFVGCLLSNVLTGCVVWDIIFGSLATLFAAYLSLRLKKYISLAVLPPVIINALAVPFILKYAYGIGDAWWYLCITVGIGQLIVCGIFAPMLTRGIKKHIRVIDI